MLSGSPGPFIAPHGRTSRKRRVLDGIKRAMKKRCVLPGFPVIEHNFSRQEADEYYSCEKITCLLCGRRLCELPTHLRRIHGVTVENYQGRYGLPKTRGLTSQLSFDKRSTTIKKLLEEPDRLAINLSTLAKSRTVAATSKKTKPPYAQGEQRLAAKNPQGRYAPKQARAEGWP